MKSIFIIVLLLISYANHSSFAQKISIESGEIPPDMKIEDFTLIGVLKGKKSYDKYVEKEFSKYTGKYVLATEDEISKKYSDTTKYRYIMDYKMEHGTISHANRDNKKYGQQPYEDRRTTGFRYFVLDRKEKKEYLRKSRSSFFALEMRTYLSAIESIRKKN